MTQEAPAAILWRFGQAPKELKVLSEHGGDEDWLAELPPGSLAVDLFYCGSAFGSYQVSEHPHPSTPGWTVLIGAHA